MNDPRSFVKRHQKFKFSLNEDVLLRRLVSEFGESNWHRIAAEMRNRSARQCRERWFNYLSPNIKNAPWTKKEDALLLEKFQEQGPQWHDLARFFPMRTDINIKNRYHVLSRKMSKDPPNLPPLASLGHVTELPPVSALFSNPEFNIIPPLNVRKRVLVSEPDSHFEASHTPQRTQLQDVPPTSENRPFSLASLLKA
jgi:hypothetical protein